MNVRQPHEYRVKGRRQGGGSNHEFLKSPWIKHYRTIGEVSDQNFANEVTKGENSGSSKKMKTVMNGSSSTDQVNFFSPPISLIISVKCYRAVVLIYCLVPWHVGCSTQKNSSRHDVN